MNSVCEYANYNFHYEVVFLLCWINFWIFFQDVTMENYIKLLMEHKVSHLVCATDQAYKTDDLAKSGSLFFAHRAWLKCVCRCGGVRTFLPRRIRTDPGDHRKVALARQQGVHGGSWHLRWGSLRHWVGASSCSCSHRSHWAWDEIWGEGRARKAYYEVRRKNCVIHMAYQSNSSLS